MNPIEYAIGDLTQAKDQLVRTLDNTPDDRIAWSPAPTARNPLHIVAHSAFSLGFIAKMLEGTPYPAATKEIADAEFLEMEKAIETRQQALDLLENRYDAYVAVLNRLTESDLSKSVVLPFGMGEAPLNFLITVGALHTRTHISQLEYLQTIYGDRVW